jgi:hypothetical protein
LLVARWSQGLQLTKGVTASNGGERAGARGFYAGSAAGNRRRRLPVALLPGQVILENRPLVSRDNVELQVALGEEFVSDFDRYFAAAPASPA